MNDPQALCNEWNDANPPGSPVTLLDGDVSIEDTTSSSAFCLAGGKTAIFLTSRTTPVRLDKVRPREIIPPPSMDDLESAIRAVLPRVPSSHTLLVKVCLVDASDESQTTAATRTVAL